jgi:cyclic beta-1,2-glucan synthetase
MALVRLDSRKSTDLLAEMLEAHRYLRALGVRIDLVVVDEAPSGYVEHGLEALRRFLAERDATGLLHERGGVHVVAVDQAAEQELLDIEATARVHVDSRKGSLERQLSERGVFPVGLPAFTPAGPPPGTEPDPELSLEVPALDFDTGFGGFHGDEYVVRPGAVPPAPWCNVIANEHFGCLVSEGALGSSWSLNASENRLTPWHNDAVTDQPAEVLYLRDEETAQVWSTTEQPAGVPTLVRHGHGYTVSQQACLGLEQTQTVFVPPDDPVKIVCLRIDNRTSRPRRLTATYYAEWVLGTQRRETGSYVRPELSAGDSCLLAETSWSADFGGRVAFLATDRPLHGYTTDRGEMLGRGGSLARPAAKYFKN